MNEKMFHQYILDTGLASEDQVNLAKNYDPDLFIEEALEKLGFSTVQEIYTAISENLGIPLVDLTITIPSIFAVRLVIPRVLRKYQVVPLTCDDEVIEIATSCPGDFVVLDAIRFACDREVIEHMAKRRQIVEALDDVLGSDGEHKSVDIMSAEDAAKKEAAAEEDARIRAMNYLTFDDLDAEHEATTIINQLLKNAIYRNASDIHFEPRPDAFHIRDRIDGELHLVSKLHHSAGRTIISRLKVLAKMNIAERKKPQDGSFTVTSKGKRTDLRLSSMPTPYGEKIVIRFLNPDQGNLEFADVGLLPDTIELLQSLVVRPQGFCVVTGPTGSGKSSTLCSIINYVKSEDINIISIEDPIEYKIKGVNQIGVNVKQGVTFAAGLKAILRQDPDVIYVGEIRDAETAVTALQAAQTGHMVFSTLHTNDAISAITRLINMGVNTDMIADALTAVVAQRLTRRVCKECAQPVQPSEKELEELRKVNLNEYNLVQGKGCPACYHRGYAGRVPATELLVIDDKMRGLITSGAGANDYWRCALKRGMRTMWQTGIFLAAKGLTTLEEMARHIPEPAFDVAEEQEPPASAPAAQSLDNAKSTSTAGAQTRKPVERAGDDNSDIPRTILVVDDEPAVRRLLEKGLKMLKADVISAEDGNAAIRMIHEHNPDIVISDIHMPNCDGISLCRKIKEDPTIPKLPVIILTGDPSVEAEIQSFEIGAVDFVRKPVRVPALIARLKSLYRRSLTMAE